MQEETIPTEAGVDFWEADPVFRAVARRSLPDGAWDAARPVLEEMGRRAGLEIPPLAAIADRQSPRLVTHDARGTRIDRIEYHPAYRRMEEVAYGLGCVAVKYEEGPLRPFRHRVGFALSYLFSQAESGLFCPVCMTDGLARVLEKFGSEEQQRRYIPRLASRRLDTLFRGAMFLTEKQGGSDVGATATRARRDGAGWRLTGEKWFCSNVDAEIALTLARPEGAPDGTRGLGLFLVRRDLPDGRRNAYRIERIKEKLGVRSMPTGEVTLLDTEAELVGDPHRGFRMMAEMLNMSRLYNAVASVSGLRRACLEARHFITHRRAFGRPVIELPLAREALEEVEARHLAALLCVWRVVELLDLADGGDPAATAAVRMLTPLIKYTTAKLAVWGVSECLELHGGHGYIEESVMPRMLRDVQVLPIWEGTTNILVLDTLRALRKTGGLHALLDAIRSAGDGTREGKDLAARCDALGRDLTQAVEGRYPEGKLRQVTDRLMRAFEIAELLRARSDSSLSHAAEAALVRQA